MGIFISMQMNLANMKLIRKILINKIPDDKRKDVLKTVNESIESRVKENDSKIKDDKLEYNNKNVLNIDNARKSNKDDIDK